jgi:hypothetical protein
MLQRLIGVFKLDSKTFEEIEGNKDLTGQAAILVIIVSLISGLGSGFLAIFQKKGFIGGFFGSILSVLLGWLLWSFITWLVGTKLFKGTADIGEMLRVIGFAYTPQVLSIIPCIGGLIGAIWTLAAGFIAVRQGLDLDNTKALLTIVIGFVCYLLLTAVLSAFIGGVGLIF